MLTKAVARFIRVSPRKARLVADVIRGRSVAEALSVLQYSPQAAARLIEKVLRSAIANAEHNHQVRNLDDLRVGAIIDGGPTLKRIQPRAMGRAFHIVHRTSHITVTLSDKREFQAKVIGTDPKTDLAVIKIEADNLPSLKWADYDKLQVGDLVLAVGSPFGLSSTVTLGIISALGRGNVGIADYEDFVQTDAAINPGNSGGALVSMNGELIGINTAIFSRTGGSEGIGFAIPSSIALDIVDSLRKTGKVVRGWMGVAIQEITPALAKSFKIPDSRKGVLISDVNENGPSSAAGLKRGDVIIGFDDKDVQNVSQLRNLVARTLVGHDAKVKVLREGKEQLVTVKVGERPPDEMLARREPASAPSEPTVKPPDNVLASLRVQALDAAMMGQLNLPGKTTGVVINHVEPGGAAEAAGLQRGDVIQEVNHEVIKSLEDYQKASAKIKKEEMAVLLLSRQGNNLFVAVNPR